ncbi:MAG: hypothetical protein WBD02_06910 [Acidimicrobiia bacterium]
MKSILVLWQVSARARIWNGDELVDDPSSSGVSDADRSALATALALAEPETIITVLSVGGAASADVLREAAAHGAHRVVHIATPHDDLEPGAVAELIAPHSSAADLICSGDVGASGLVPVLLAAHLGYPSVTAVLSVVASSGGLNVHRRLEGGRRQDLFVSGPVVLAIEPGRELPRASLPNVLASQRVETEVHPVTVIERSGMTPVTWLGPPSWIDAPAGDAATRIAALTGNSGSGASGRRNISCDPELAASEIINQLSAWGYLDTTTPK